MEWKNNNDNIDYNTRYANWNKFYDDLETEIKNIRDIGNTLLFDLDSKVLTLNRYYSMIANLFSTHKSYILKNEIVECQLDKIEITLFGDEYLKAIKNNPLKIKKLRLKLIKDLRKIFSQICNDFSLMGLRPKIETVDTSKYSDELEGEEKEQAIYLERHRLI